MDKDVLKSARLWGAKDGSTALTILHARQFMFVANAGDGSGRGRCVVSCSHAMSLSAI